MKRTPATHVVRLLHDTNVVPGTGTPFPVPATREERFLPGHSAYGHDIVAPRRDVFDDADWEDAAPAPWEAAGDDEEDDDEDDAWDTDDVPESYVDALGRACYGTARSRRLVD